MAEQWWSKYEPTEYSFAEWKTEANRLYKEEGLTKEQIQEQIGYPVDDQGNAIKTTNKGSKVNPKFDTRTGDRASQEARRGAAAASQTVGEDVYNKGVVAPSGSGLQEHHKRVVGLYKPFFEGLNPAETKELAQWFVDEGAPLGNVQKNLEALTEQEHESIHAWMKKHRMQVSNKKFPSFKNVPLNERFPAILTYLEQIQPAADEQLDKLKLMRKGAKGLAIAGTAAPFAVGLPMSAAETASRYQISQETQDPIDAAQTVLSGTSFVGDAMSLFPPAAPLGEGISTFADVANTGIDIYREDPEKAKELARGAVKNVAENVLPNPVRDVQRLIDRFSGFQKRLLDKAKTLEEKDALITQFKNK